MADLSTEYLGLSLKNPIVPSSSPLSRDLDSAQRLQDAGAAAIIMHSLFEEKIEEESERLARFVHEQSLGHGEAESFHPMPQQYTSYQDEYLEQLQRLKDGLDIPIIASLNGTSLGGWVEYGLALQQAGADALELNVYYVAGDEAENANRVEQRYLDILGALREQVQIPIAMKLSSQFSALIDLAQKLELAGVDGISLFNRFYQPDIDLESLEVVPRLALSTSAESLLRIRWAAMLFGRVQCSLAVTGGFHTAEDALKALLAGSDVVHVCSGLLQQGPGLVADMLRDMHEWLEEKEYESVAQLKGSVSQQHAADPAAFARANYINVLDNYSPAPGVRR